MREVDGHELVATYDDPFVRHQVDPARVRRAYVDGPAVVVESESHLPGADGTVAMALGPAPALARLLADVPDVARRTARVSVPSAAYDVLPPTWQPAPAKQWHWMTTHTRPAPPATLVEEVTDEAEVDALLDAHAPDAHARPGSPRIECWLGVRSGGTLLAAGALQRQSDGTGHLRAVTVVPEARGRGLGRDVSAALTLRALAGRSGVATLGVYTDNRPALAIYRHLGYAVAHTFASGRARG